MKLIATLFELNRLEDVLKHADGILMGNVAFGTRLTRSFASDDIIYALEQTKKRHQSFFLMANQMMDDTQLEAFSAFLKNVPAQAFTGIIVADIGAIMVLKELDLNHLAIYHPETLHTNHYDFNFLSQLKIYGAFVAKEITLKEIITIGNNKAHKLFMMGHGHLNMFYSKRHLIENFSQVAHIKNQYIDDQNLKIKESERLDEPYPILEDKAGTHVFRHHVSSTYDHLSALKPFVDYMVIDTLFKDDDYAIDVLTLYTKNQEDLKAMLEKKYQETWDHGFLNKKTVYKKE